MVLAGRLLLQVSLLMVARIVRLPRPLISSLCSVNDRSKETVTLFGNVLNIVPLFEREMGIGLFSRCL